MIQRKCGATQVLDPRGGPGITLAWESLIWFWVGATFSCFAAFPRSVFDQVSPRVLVRFWFSHTYYSISTSRYTCKYAAACLRVIYTLSSRGHLGYKLCLLSNFL